MYLNGWMVEWIAGWVDGRREGGINGLIHGCLSDYAARRFDIRSSANTSLSLSSLHYSPSLSLLATTCIAPVELRSAKRHRTLPGASEASLSFVGKESQPQNTRSSFLPHREFSSVRRQHPVIPRCRKSRFKNVHLESTFIRGRVSVSGYLWCQAKRW